MSDLFRRLAHRTSTLVGTPWAFLIAFGVVLTWAVSGPLFGFSDTWQLVINTATTIVTFLMVFLIQNTQNRDSRAIHMKLDELIVFTKGADNNLVDLENLSDEQLDLLEEQFHRLANKLGHKEIEEHDLEATREAARSRRTSNRSEKQNGGNGKKPARSAR